MEDGELTSVQLTRAYIRRIEALNKSGPGLNAVTQLNEDALKDAALLDKERANGHLRSAAHGLPVLLKDLIDVKGMYTSNGNYSLRNSFPAQDSGVAEKLRERGVVILGKLGLSEYANFFGNQPSGFANLTGQVLGRAGRRPERERLVVRLRRGRRRGVVACSSIGTETSGSIISPSQANGIVGLRPTVGLVPGVGIGPISASQDTAGPMDRTVENAALTLTAIAGNDPESSYDGLWGLTPAEDDLIIPPAPDTVPDYLSALDLELRPGQAHRLQRRPDDREPPGADAGRGGEGRPRGRRRDPGRAADGAQSADRHSALPDHRPELRGEAGHQPLLREPRPARADQLAGRGDRRQQRRVAPGAQVRQRHARRW